VSEPSTLDRIVADNDPRNGSIAQRLIHMLEQPDRQPNEEGLYDDSSAGGKDQ
jgi:hypothetical protein